MEWETAIEFATKNFPPLDETTIALHVQAALCSFKNDRDNAKTHADVALKMHDLLFGGGKKRFFKRYDKELRCPMRPVDETESMNIAKKLFK